MNSFIAVFIIKKDENKYIFFLEWTYELTAPKQCSFETGGGDTVIDGG